MGRRRGVRTALREPALGRPAAAAVVARWRRGDAGQRRARWLRCGAGQAPAWLGGAGARGDVAPSCADSTRGVRRREQGGPTAAWRRSSTGKAGFERGRRLGG